MKRAALYIRVSTAEQKMHGISIDNQEDALKEYCNDHNYIVADIYNDAGISARKKYYKRPELLRLMDDCRNGKIDIILFTRLDRWFRSVSDYYQVQSVLDECKVPWRAIWEDYETETSSGVFKVNIMLSISQAEADRTKEKVKSVKQYQKDKGEYVGQASLGYIKKDNKLSIDEASREGIQALWDTYLKTYSQAEALEAAKQHGVIMHKATVGRILHNPAYYGLASGYYPCDAYVTKEQWDTVQEHMSMAPRRTKLDRVYLFSGLVRCSCGQRMGGSYTCRKTSKGVYNHQFYKCLAYQKKLIDNSCHNTVMEAKVEKYLLANLDAIIYEYNTTSSVQAIDKANQVKIKQKKSLEQKLKRLALLFEDGDIDINDYRMKRDAIKRELSMITLEKEKAPVSLPYDWKDTYKSLSQSNKQKFWRNIIEYIIVTPDKQITVKFR